MTTKPWYISTENDPDLCNICSQINFAFLLKHDFNQTRWQRWKSGAAHDDEDAQAVNIPWVSETRQYVFPELSLGFIWEIVEKKERCSVCRLVSLSISEAYSTTVDNLPSSDFNECPFQFVFCTLNNHIKDFQDQDIYDLVIDITDIRRDFCSLRKILLHEILDDVDDAAEPYAGRRLPEQVDFKAMSDWLNQFDLAAQEHLSSGAIVPGFRVIDVVNKSVVEVDGPRGCKYLALSYVWGGLQNHQNTVAIKRILSQPGSLTNYELPQTIVDALEITNRAGKQYLWVDSLCIVQDDIEAKTAQINAMDQIFNCALATIIAASGTSCHDGLPGVSPIPGRWKQHVMKIQGILLANKQMHRASAVPSVWHNRGWTFQEHALSRRCIHFSNDGLEFESEDGIHCGDTFPPLHDPNRQVKDQLCIPSSSSRYLDILPTFQLFGLAVRLYSFRNLTYQTDAVDAFKGVLNLYQSRFRRDYVYAMPSSELDLALLWLPLSRLERRISEKTRDALFPTWSWVAWKGMLSLPETGTEPSHFSRVTWVDAIDGTTRFTTAEWRGEESDALADWECVPNRGRLCAPWFFETENQNHRFEHPVSREIPELLKKCSFLRNDSHILTFYALSATIASRPGTRSLREQMEESQSPPKGVISHDLHDRFDRFCGTVYIHPQDHNFDTSLLECLVISRTAYNDREGSTVPPPDNDEDVTSIRDSYAERQKLRQRSDGGGYMDYYDFQVKWQAYDILVIQRRRDDTASRVGVGFCLCEALWDAEPVRKRIRLR